MKNKFMLFLMMGFLMVALVSAGSDSTKINLFEKNPSDWSVVDDGGSAKLQLVSKTHDKIKRVDWGYGKWKVVKETITTNKVLLRAKDLTPNMDYTLVYYGDATHNDVYPFVTCIASETTNRRGNLQINQKTDLDVGSMFGDSEQQKFWVVKSSDLDCDAGVFTSWNPTEYLFEETTI